MFTTNTPVVNATHDRARQRDEEPDRLGDHEVAHHRLRAERQLTLTLGSGTAAITTPVTVPGAATGGSLGAYGGNRTGWSNTPWLVGQTYNLPSTVAYPR